MWNKIAELAQEVSYKRLAIALLLSILLHTFLFGGLDISLPFLKKEMHTIEARIQMPKVVPKAEPKSAPKLEEPKPDHKKEPPPDPKPEAAPEPVPEITPEVVTPAPQVPVESVPLTEPKNIAPAPEPELPQPKDEGLVINENAYQYVETYFDVRTKIDGPAEGQAKVTYQLVDESHYQLNFVAEAKGLAAIFIPDWVQTSQGLLTKAGLQPQNYVYKFGDKEDKTRKALFDWQNKTLQLTTSKGVTNVPLVEGTQDQLSFMYQFMYVAPLQEMQLNITNGKKLREYYYAFQGDENVNSPLGEVRSIHIEHTGIDVDEKTELWLAIDYQYVPVKIRKTEKDGKVYEFLATRVVTTRPTIDQLEENKK